MISIRGITGRDVLSPCFLFANDHLPAKKSSFFTHYHFPESRFISFEKDFI